jgi:hypothetical protein
MSTQFPRRGESHQLEEVSERYVRNALPRGWTSEKPQHDYGVDLRIDIFEDGAATGLELLVQLKASAESTEGETEVLRLRTATYNHLWSKLQVVMLVKYVESINEAFWLLLKDIQAPAADQETFNVHIPKANRLSATDVPQSSLMRASFTTLAHFAISERMSAAHASGEPPAASKPSSAMRLDLGDPKRAVRFGLHLGDYRRHRAGGAGPSQPRRRSIIARSTAR